MPNRPNTISMLDAVNLVRQVWLENQHIDFNAVQRIVNRTLELYKTAAKEAESSRYRMRGWEL